MTPHRHGSAIVELPNDLDVLITREFDAPIALLFDVLTKPEHVRKWFAPRGCEMKECSIDLRAGGKYHQVFVTSDGAECAFRGTYLEVEPPARTVATWVFEGRPQLEAIETTELHQAGGVTRLTVRSTYRDEASRDEAITGGFDEVGESFDQMEELVWSMLDSGGALAG